MIIPGMHIALMGISMGGYLAPRAAAYEHRLAALIANGGPYDMIEQNIPPGMSRQEYENLIYNQTEPYDREAMKAAVNSTQLDWGLTHGMWVFGAKNPSELARKLYDALQCPKTYIKFKAFEGAELHCQMGATNPQHRRCSCPPIHWWVVDI